MSKLKNRFYRTNILQALNDLPSAVGAMLNFKTSLRLEFRTTNIKSLPSYPFFFDLTRQVSLHKLFRLYQEFYPRKEAIQKFLNHFNIEGYFEPLALLTNTEIQILISMRDDSRCKAVANALGISVATASNHISNIRSKLNSGTLHDVLLKLPAIPESEQSMYAYV